MSIVYVELDPADLDLLGTDNPEEGERVLSMLAEVALGEMTDALLLDFEQQEKRNDEPST